MTNNYSIAKQFINIIRDWRDAKSDSDEQEKKAAALLRLNESKQASSRRDAEDEKGKAVGKIASSGVSVSSFGDALRDRDVSVQREISAASANTENEASALKRQARKKRNAADLRYSFGFIFPFFKD